MWATVLDENDFFYFEDSPIKTGFSESHPRVHPRVNVSHFTDRIQGLSYGRYCTSLQPPLFLPRLLSQVTAIAAGVLGRCDLDVANLQVTFSVLVSVAINAVRVFSDMFFMIMFAFKLKGILFKQAPLGKCPWFGDVSPNFCVAA